MADPMGEAKLKFETPRVFELLGLLIMGATQRNRPQFLRA